MLGTILVGSGFVVALRRRTAGKTASPSTT